MFTIRPSGLLDPVGDPVPTPALPRGIVLSPRGDVAYVVNGGAHKISSYRVGVRGELTPLGPPVDTVDEPFGIAVAPDSRAVYVTAFDATVSAFAVRRDGTLEPIGKPLLVDGGRLTARGVTVSPDGRYVFVSTGDIDDPAQGVLATYAVRADHTLELLRTKQIEPGAFDIGVTPDGRFLYVACSGTNHILPFRIGPGGVLSPLAAASAPEFPISAVIHDHLMFVTAGGDDAGAGKGVWVFALGPDGTPRPTGKAPAAAGEAPVWPASDGRHLYVSSEDLSAELFGFDVSRTGALTPLASSPFPAGGQRSMYQSTAIRY
ncbi:sugar lactone lactonase YvrE [Kibdelosporangium banguiense]|uniref:Sugar lactone lactonase YvrE n=1 Tax=Kibdelosporangium banguiense TaxID=1365924 RepID=A0ABS4TZ46_9PSEU|nr:beta-propeller fold lactonase family protein [Kibdelosporangium banguiense]MBP2329684.1 sugar lactone lactonase YvrE [Kibdelosporangium banguiense]